MDVFELVVALLLGGALLTSLAHRVLVPPPALLALAGALLAFVPGVPDIRLDPSLALALFVAPVLLDAAYDASPRDLRDNWRPILALVVALVTVTTAVVAVVARALLPDLPWAAAVALGAIVAPPDAAAASAILRRLKLPHRVLVILESESLLNDASALLIFRLATTMAVGGVSMRHEAMHSAFGIVAGIVMGIGLARMSVAVFGRPTRDQAAAVTAQFLVTFSVWLLADRLGFSPILTIVAYAITIAQRGQNRMPARLRLASYAVWEVVVHILNLLAFILIGLQLRGIVERLHGHWTGYLGFAAAVSLTVIVVRLAWVLTYSTLVQWKNARFGVALRRPMRRPSTRTALVIGWCGMRGIVTLATALALPDPFPHRDELLFAAFLVTLTTLVLQGFTLGLLLRVLNLGDDDAVTREAALARAETARAALRTLEHAPDTPASMALRRDYEHRLQRAERAEMHGSEPPELPALRRRLVSEERRVLYSLRAQDQIGDDAFHQVEEELDWSEANATARLGDAAG